MCGRSRRCTGRYRVKRIVHGIAHITGGGLVENLPRILPEGHGIVLRRGFVDGAEVFPWLQALGSVEAAEMDRVFNMGIGLVIVVAEYFAEAIVRRLSRRLKIPCVGHRRSGARASGRCRGKGRTAAGVCNRCTELPIRVSSWVQLDAVYWWPPCEAVPVRWSDGIRLLDERSVERGHSCFATRSASADAARWTSRTSSRKATSTMRCPSSSAGPCRTCAMDSSHHSDGSWSRCATWG